MKPIFLLSLPRSGSTLLQRVLASHVEISTVSEPWLLLPLVYSFREKGVIAEYEHKNLAHAMEDFCQLLPNGKKDCYQEMRQMVLNLYAKIGSDATYFLDKTPRYHLIVDELVEIFPDCKIILLWRNPLAVAASMIETWGGGKWNLHWFDVDLYKGVENLLSFHEKYHKNILTMKFEDFVAKPEECSNKLFEYLGLPVVNATDEFSNVDLEGRMGDPTGVKKYHKVSDESLNKWKQVLSNPIRQLWCRHYLNWLGDERLSRMGYSMKELKNESGSISLNNLVSDIVRIGYSPFYKYKNI